jgi:hypothetical protein
MVVATEVVADSTNKPVAWADRVVGPATAATAMGSRGMPVASISHAQGPSYSEAAAAMAASMVAAATAAAVLEDMDSPPAERVPQATPEVLCVARTAVGMRMTGKVSNTAKSVTFSAVEVTGTEAAYGQAMKKW